MYQKVEDVIKLNYYRKKFIIEWVNHFLSVCDINGGYEGEFWNVIPFGNYWNIVGNEGFIFSSTLNNDEVNYYSPYIILRELIYLEPHVYSWFNNFIEKENNYFKDIPKNMLSISSINLEPEFSKVVDEEFWNLL